MGKRKVRPFAFADTESTIYEENKGTRVYLWVVIDSQDNKYIGYDVNTLIDYIIKSEEVIFFHNLKHDFSFIHYQCLKRGIPCKILYRKGTYYSVKIGKGELRDTFNFIPLSLEEIGDTFGTRNRKGRLAVYEKPYEYEPTQEDIDYCMLDVMTLKESFTAYLSEMSALLLEHDFIKAEAKLRTSLTISSVAYTAFTEKNLFSKLCPKTSMSEYQMLRPAYQGGFVYSRESGIERNVLMLDENSMYPDKYRNQPMPVGRMISCETLDEALKANFSVIKVSIRYDLKKGFIPIIGNTGFIFSNANYKASSDGDYEELTTTNLDLKLIIDFYECDIIFLWAVKWETVNNLYSDYTDLFMSVKAKSKGVRRFIAKQMLNRPYGKLAIDGFSQLYDWHIDDIKKVVTSEVTGYEVSDNTYQYLPQAIAITAYARDDLLRTAMKIGFNKIYYMDTDSIKCSTSADLSGIRIDERALGAWKVEGRAELFKTIAPKRYMYFEDGRPGFANAGFNSKDFGAWVYSQISDKETKKANEEEALAILRAFDHNFKLEVKHSKLVKGGRVIVKEVKKIN